MQTHNFSSGQSWIYAITNDKMDLLNIDGSTGEGGGQILRTALSLSCILQRPIEIEKIRGGRKNPGLQPQHLTSVKAAAEISRARVKGVFLGSQHLTFEPQIFQGGEYAFDVAQKKGSAGSVGLIFQTIAPILAFAKEQSRVVIKGGTHTAWSPPCHYIQEVFLPNLSRMGLFAHALLIQWGFYPQGGGEMIVEIEPVKKLVGKAWGNGEKRLMRIKGISAVAHLPSAIAERQRDRVLDRLKRAGFDAEIQIAEANAKGRGSFLFLVVDYESASLDPSIGRPALWDEDSKLRDLPAAGVDRVWGSGGQGVLCGFSALGERGKPAEKVADEACDAFLRQHRSRGTLDPHMADQILLYAVLAEGKTQFTTSKITNHFLTNLWVLRQFLPVKVQVSGGVGEEGSILIEGLEFITRARNQI